MANQRILLELPAISRGIFVTGTDTGVGKTLVAAGILRWLRNRGIDAIPMKPVQTGAVHDGNNWIAPDLEFCLAASGLQPTVEEKKLMLPYAYEPACSPHLAGRLAIRYPELPVIQQCAGKLLKNHQALVVEGAGGILVPLDEQHTMLDLMVKLDYPVVLVSRFGLGAINHSLLSIRALHEAGLVLLGVVFNRTERSQPENRFIEEDNPDAIARFGKVPVLGKIDYLENIHPEMFEIWDKFETKMPGIGAILENIRHKVGNEP